METVEHTPSVAQMATEYRLLRDDTIYAVDITTTEFDSYVFRQINKKGFYEESPESWVECARIVNQELMQLKYALEFA